MAKLYYYLQRKTFTIAIPFLYSHLRKKNPIMQLEMNGQKIRLPFNHMGPIYQKTFENYDRQLGRICTIIYDKLHRINVIDIGANIGDTIVNIGLGGGKYLAIEGEKDFFSLLKENTQNYDVYYENVFLSDNENGCYRNAIINGTSSLVKDDTNEVNVITLDRLMEIKYSDFKADLIKIDTDGFDFKVIRGGKDYIKNTKPIIFFEWSKEDLNAQGEDELSIFQELDDMGYRDIILFDNFGNKVLSITSSDMKILRCMINYTANKDKRIHYYDVLAIHKEFPCSMNDFECL